MKKKPADAPRARRPARVAEDEILPEYSLRGSKPSPYAERMRDAVIAVTLDPDVAVVFPDSRAVNRALRSLIAAEPRKKLPSKELNAILARARQAAKRSGLRPADIADAISKVRRGK